MNVATPVALVVPETVTIVDEPLPFASVTVLPGSGLPFESLIVAVTVEVVEPSASTEVGEAESVDRDVLAAVAAGRIATITAVLSRLVIVELFAAIAPEAA